MESMQRKSQAYCHIYANTHKAITRWPEKRKRKKNPEVLAFSVLQTNKSFAKGHNNVTR